MVDRSCAVCFGQPNLQTLYSRISLRIRQKRGLIITHIMLESRMNRNVTSRLNVIVTRNGDNGVTDLVSRKVKKTSRIIDLIGCLDEANCAIGNALNQVPEMDRDHGEMFLVIQNNLFDLGADIISGKNKIEQANVEYLEEMASKINAKLPPLQSFVIPRGKTASIHLARAIVRRAERSFWRIKIKHMPSLQQKGIYLNRLSDLLFIVARDINHRYTESEEEIWKRL